MNKKNFLSTIVSKYKSERLNMNELQRKYFEKPFVFALVIFGYFYFFRSISNLITYEILKINLGSLPYNLILFGCTAFLYRGYQKQNLFFSQDQVLKIAAYFAVMVFIFNMFLLSPENWTFLQKSTFLRGTALFSFSYGLIIFVVMTFCNKKENKNM